MELNIYGFLKKVIMLIISRVSVSEIKTKQHFIFLIDLYFLLVIDFLVCYRFSFLLMIKIDPAGYVRFWQNLFSIKR